MKIYIPLEELNKLVKGDTYNFRGRSFVFLGTNNLIRYCPQTFLPFRISYLNFNFNGRIILSVTRSDKQRNEKEDIFEKLENVYLTLRNFKHSKSLLLEKEIDKSQNNILYHLEDLEKKSYNYTI